MIKNLLNIFLLLAISTLGFSQTYPPSQSNNSTQYEYITNVTFGTILNNSTGIDSDIDADNIAGYDDFTSLSTIVAPGSTHTLSITINDDANDYIYTWFDWNDDGDFTDAGEEFEIVFNTTDPGPHTLDITIPASAAGNDIRMRVSLKWNGVPASDEATFGYGEVEDYSVSVSAVVPSNRADLMYYVSDADNKLYLVNVTNGDCSEIGDNGVTNIEAIANWPGHLGNKLYAANGGDLMTLNTSTGAATLIGEIDGGGTANGSVGGQTLNDVDGLAFDARTGILWGSNRRSGVYDLMFQIDVTTGNYIPDAFGDGIDYVVIDGTGVNLDIDDISISPVTGEMFVVNNNGGSNDQILKINKSTGVVEITTVFSSLSDVEGCDFAFDGTFYVSEGGGNSFNSASATTGSSSVIKDPLCGSGDVECLASLVEETNTMEGNVWRDIDEDGVKDAGETTGIADVEIKIYYDANGDGIINGSDEYLNTIKTDVNGDWSFEYATTGHLIAEIDETSLPDGYALTSFLTQTANFTTSGTIDSNNDFGAIDGTDCDSDGIPDFKEGSGDSDGDGIDDQCDKDSDNDGILDADESTKDTDGDGIADYLDLDSDNDGIPDAKEANGGSAPSNYSNIGRITGAVDAWGLPTAVYTGGISSLPNYDSDGDGAKDNRDLDSDNDGILDIIEAGGEDSDGNGTADSFFDNNNDGYHDSFVNNPLPIYNNDIGTEAETLPNYRDIDSDGDSIDDTREGYSPEDYQTVSIVKDSDGDGVLDIYDISSGGASIVPFDYNNNGIPDYLDINSDSDQRLDIVEGNDANNDDIADTSPIGVDVNMNGLDDAFDNVCTGSSSIDIIASSKNEETVSSGSANTSSSDLELVYDGKQQIIGIRFTGVNIAQGASVRTTNIQFVADSKTSSEALTLTIKGDDADNAGVVGGVDDVSGRTKTTATVSWSPEAWNTAGEAGDAQRTPDISSIIQEIVNRPGWVSGNAIMIIIEGTATTASRHAEWNNGAPVLKIATDDGLQYNCGSDIVLNDNDNDTYLDFRDVPNAELPVSLISFTAEKVDDHVNLKWTTASEINNDYFSVEKSNDNKNYKEIDLVNGAGNSNVTLDYNSIDFDLSKGVSYYRLKQVDYDGTTAYSNVVAVRNIDGEKAKLYPNPNNGQFVIEVKDAVEVSIHTVTGQIVYSNTFEDNSNNSVDLSNQKQGVYIVTYYYRKEVITSKLIIK